MADLHTATVIADVDLLDTVEFPVRKNATAGLLKATFAKLKTYLLTTTKFVQFSDVDVSTPPTDGQALVYNATATKWKPGAGGGGGTSNYAPFDWTDYSPLTAHRYWRVLMTSGLTIAELYLLDINAATLTGTWTANNTGNGGTANLNDGNGGTFWGSGTTGTVAAPNWLVLDLGAGVTAIVDQIQMTARTSFQSQTPTDFKLQYSDDNATWVDACAVANSVNWGSGQRRIFRVRPYIVQFYFDEPNIQTGGTTITYAELEILQGTTDLTVPATTSDAIAGSIMGTSDGNDASFAFDNSTSGYSGNAGLPTLTEYRFGTNPGLINGVSVTARSGFGGQAPGSVKVRYSRDGLTYRTAYQSPLQQSAWASLEKRYFSLSEKVTQPWSHARYFMATAANSPANAWAKVPIDWPDQHGLFDDQQMWDNTNKRFTPKKPGFYLVNCRASTSTSGSLTVAVAKNGSNHSYVGASGSGLNAAGGSAIVYCNGSTDYIELYCFTDAARAYATTSGGNSMDNYLEVMGPI